MVLQVRSIYTISKVVHSPSFSRRYLSKNRYTRIERESWKKRRKIEVSFPPLSFLFSKFFRGFHRWKTGEEREREKANAYSFFSFFFFSNLISSLEIGEWREKEGLPTISRRVFPFLFRCFAVTSSPVSARRFQIFSRNFRNGGGSKERFYSAYLVSEFSLFNEATRNILVRE